jgi:UPF0716 family protein affecting phage T7 exclusion
METLVEILGMLLQLFLVIGIFITLALLLVLSVVAGYSILEWRRRRRTTARDEINRGQPDKSSSEGITI